MIFFIFLSILVSSLECNSNCYSAERTSHHLSAVGVQDILNLNKILKSKSNLKKIFSNINLIRPVGSNNHFIVRKFITDYLSILKWNVEEIPFSVDTIIGPKNFVNIISTQNISKARRLILACHYDSLTMKDFFGSIDSAIPCALMLSIAELLTPFLKKSNIDVSLELIFFDGEEAFKQWSAIDSLYGSRHLAALWENAMNSYKCSKLKAIDSMVLLDLLGANDPKFYFFTNGNYRLFESLRRIESTIEQQQNVFGDSRHPYFSKYSTDSVVQDDHVPFLERGVPIVHLIPVPFPTQWHKISDDANGISWETTQDLELILSVFVVQYFHLGNLLSNLQNDELF